MFEVKRGDVVRLKCGLEGVAMSRVDSDGNFVLRTDKGGFASQSIRRVVAVESRPEPKAMRPGE